MQGLYLVDNVPGLKVVTFVKYGTHGNHTHVCEIGIRLPGSERVSHCLPKGFCPPGFEAMVDFEFLEDVHKGPLPFKSLGFDIHKQRTFGGNYQEFLDFSDECTQEGSCPLSPLFSWSYNRPHVEVHFHMEDVTELLEVNGPVPMPSSDIQAKCDRLA